MPVRRAALLGLMLCGVAACGYRLAGKGTTLPDHVQRIAVPLFKNDTNQPDIAQRITESVADEFIRRLPRRADRGPRDGRLL